MRAPRGAVLALLAGLAAPALALAASPRADWGLPAVKAAARPWLGISITEVEGGVRSPETPGLTLARVIPGGPAAVAGIQAGDVLLAVDGRVLQGAHALKSALDARAPGDEIELMLLRGSSVLTRKLRLGTAPAGGQERKVQPLPPVVAALPAAPAPAAPASPGARTPGSVALTFVGDASRPSLGIDTMDLEPGLAAYFGAPAGQGVLVESVAPGSAAARVGVRAGDVLLGLAGKPVGSGTALAQALRERSSGERVSLTVLRQRRTLEIPVTLGADAVPEWRLEAPVAAATTPARPTEALSALVQHHAREIARLEVLLAAEEEGDEELAALLGRRSGGDAALQADAASLRLRLKELRREMHDLQAQLDPKPRTAPAARSAPPPARPGNAGSNPAAKVAPDR